MVAQDRFYYKYSMCAMRNSRATDPTVLATHYRLTTTPRRVQPKRIERRRSSNITKDQPKEMHPSITVEDEANNITVKLQAKFYNEHDNAVLESMYDFLSLLLCCTF